MSKYLNLSLLVILAITTVAHCHLNVIYEWKEIDFQYSSPEERRSAIENQTFIPENVMPVGLEVYENRLFITLPRWKNGVPASLAYINLNGKLMTLQYLTYYLTVYK